MKLNVQRINIISLYTVPASRQCHGPDTDGVQVMLLLLYEVVVADLGLLGEGDDDRS